MYCFKNGYLHFDHQLYIKKGYAEFPNIPQLIAKNTLPFGQIMYENLSDLIPCRTRSSRCTSFEDYSTVREELPLVKSCSFLVFPRRV